jgi:hypothetical protein
MAEIKRFHLCRDPMRIEGSYDHLFEDPAIKDEDDRIAQLGPIEEGWSIHGLVRVYMGTGQDQWEQEHTKIYADFASAKADAVKRLAKVRKQYEAKKTAAAERVPV